MSAKTSAKSPGKSAPKAPKSPAKNPIDQYWDIRLNSAREAFEANRYIVTVTDSLEAARQHVLKKIIPALKPQSVTFGGSQTVAQSGLVADMLGQDKIRVINTVDYSLAPADLLEVRRQALLADLFLTSVNAATMDGKLALLDGWGNRSAAVQFGPKHVVLLISRNKIVESTTEAIERTKNIAAPMNGIRLNKKTPCAKTGECMDCKSPERMCNAWTLMEKSTFEGRIYIVLINADAGF